MLRSYVAATRAGTVLIAVWLVSAGCYFDQSVVPPTADVEGCFSIQIRGADDKLSAPLPPVGLRFSDRAFLAPDASDAQIDRHRFDARAAQEASFIYADTTLSVAWWWESVDERRFGVGNNNRFAAFYIAGTVAANRLDGEMRRWLYDDQGSAVEGDESWALPVSGERIPCGE